ncbi:uncharacterized protein LOC109260986 isoform X2 [Panthera pardus]|uniref:Uncharacterized protein LOC109260986 isoform X2 n=1 Tax=Panthera pardus TaxID=9691 RepID=A0A9V1F463_PANPR|nr:uncharacterized protein LOC109260986 isoform X2 [Panthera pardus]
MATAARRDPAESSRTAEILREPTQVVGVEETTRRSISVGVPQVRTPRQVCLPRRPAPRRYEASSRGTFYTWLHQGAHTTRRLYTHGAGGQ